MDGIKRTSRANVAKQASSLNKSRVQKSTTLNRKFVKKPVAAPKVNARVGATRTVSATRTTASRAQLLSKQHTVKLSPIASNSVVKNTTKKQSEMTLAAAARVVAERASAAPQSQVRVTPPSQMVRRVNAKTMARTAEAPVLMDMQERKERAIQDALARMSASEDMKSKVNDDFFFQTKKSSFWRSGRAMVAASMVGIILLLVGYLTYLNLPDISVRMASAKVGIEKSYPTFVPTGFRLDGLVKENDGKITMAFKNHDGKKFLLEEEKSSWDSTAVLNNYVLREWGENYTIVRGRGLTVYVSGSNAIWVNGGVLYHIESGDRVLNADDLHAIAASL